MLKVNSWKELTLREKIGQTVIALCETDKHIEMCGSIKGFAERYPIGGLFNNVGLVNGLLTGENSSFSDVLKEYNKHLRVPLIGTGDHGFYSKQIGVELPPQMSLGAASDEELSYAAGEFKSEDYKNSGVHWGFWPVCDMNTSPQSPITNTRAVGDDPDNVIKIVREEIKAMKDCGVIATIKHFPGAPFNETLDPHLAPINNTTPFDVWRNTYGKIYKELIEAGVPTIMTGHTNLVEYQSEKIDGKCPPATMSYELTNKLLREELGFDGVVVTDALVMGGFGGSQALENTVKSFLSGNDVLLWPMYEYIDEMERKILAGEIDEALLDKSVERIWNLKKEYGILDEEHLSSDKDIAFFMETAGKIAENSLTLVKSGEAKLPLSKGTNQKILIIGVTPDDKQYQEMSLLEEEFKKYGWQATMQRNVATHKIEKECENYDLVLFALCRTPHRPIGPLEFWGEDAMSIWASNCADKTKTVVASFGSPFLYKYYKNSCLTYINTYSTSRCVISAFVKALFGEIGFNGKSSVAL